MKLRIRKPHLNMSVCAILFFVVNTIYVLYYGAHVIPQSVYYVAMLGFCAFCLLMIFRDRNWNVNLGEFLSAQLIRRIGFIILSFFVISIVIQTVHMKYELFVIRYLINLVLPLLTVVCIIELDGENADSYIIILFLRCTLCFFMRYGSSFTLQNILSISIFDSKSSIMENSFAHPFLMMTIYFLYKKNRVMAVISSVLCVCCFKRFAMLMCILTWFVFGFIPKTPVNKTLLNLIKAILIIIPVGLSWLYSPAGEAWFESVFHMDLNQFVTSRYALAKMAQQDLNGVYNGFGTVKNYFANKGPYWATIYAIHCDFLELYWECSIIGVIIYVHNELELAKIDYRVLYMVLYIMVELAVGFMMSNYVVWIICYLFMMEIRREQRNLGRD